MTSRSAFDRAGASRGGAPRRAALARAVAWLVAASSVGFTLGCTDTSTVHGGAAARNGNVVVCGPGSYTGGADCIPVAAPACPSGTAPRDGQCVPSGADPQVAADPQPSGLLVESLADPEIGEILDPRHSRLKPRSRVLLVTELQQLETMLASMAASAADRPRVMRRLAEGYVELEAAAGRDQKEASRKGDANSRDEAQKAARIAVAAQRAAIKNYNAVVEQHPQFCLNPNSADPSRRSGCNDETLYYMSLEYIRGGDLDATKRAFLQILDKYPQSDYMAPTYFLMGELIRKEAASDPTKWKLAQQAYTQVVKLPDARILPYSLLRLGGVFEAQGEAENAKAVYKELVTKFPDSGAAAKVPDAMR